MPEPDHIVKRGDKGTQITATLEDEDGAPANLTGAAVSFRMAPLAGGSLIVSAAATIVGVATLGNVAYTWGTADTDEAGFYAAEWQVTYGGGNIQTHPNGGYTVIQIPPDLPL